MRIPRIFLVIFVIERLAAKQVPLDADEYKRRLSENGMAKAGNESIFSAISSRFWQILNPTKLKFGVKTFSSQYDSDNRKNARLKRAARRNYIVKCCGETSCSQGSKEKYEKRVSMRQKEREELEFASEMQYAKRKKKRKKAQNSQQGAADLRPFHAFGVFTTSSIHISCAGCPAGWSDMLTVYPEVETGIPVTCSNCPPNWPGALNLLGVGGDPTWAQGGGGQDGFIGVKGEGPNHFMTFDTGSNFGNELGASGNNFGNGFDNFGEEDVGLFDDQRGTGLDSEGESEGVGNVVTTRPVFKLTTVKKVRSTSVNLKTKTSRAESTTRPTIKQMITQATLKLPAEEEGGDGEGADTEE